MEEVVGAGADVGLGATVGMRVAPCSNPSTRRLATVGDATTVGAVGLAAGVGRGVTAGGRVEIEEATSFATCASIGGEASSSAIADVSLGTAAACGAGVAAGAASIAAASGIDVGCGAGVTPVGEDEIVVAADSASCAYDVAASARAGSAISPDTMATCGVGVDVGAAIIAVGADVGSGAGVASIICMDVGCGAGVADGAEAATDSFASESSIGSGSGAVSMWATSGSGTLRPDPSPAREPLRSADSTSAKSTTTTDAAAP